MGWVAHTTRPKPENHLANLRHLEKLGNLHNLNELQFLRPKGGNGQSYDSSILGKDDFIRLALQLRDKQLAVDVVMSRIRQTPNLNIDEAISESWDLVNSLEPQN